MLTRQGVVALAAAAVLYGLAVWLGYRSLAALALALVVVPLLGLAHLLRRADYDVTRELLPGPRVTAGEPVLVTLTLANRSSRRSPAVEVVEPVGAATRRLRVPRLAGGASTTVGYSLDDLPRGRYRIGPLTVDRSDPFGFVAATTACGSVDTLRVHPRIHPVEPLASGRLRDLDGPAVDKALEGTVTFHGLREYVR
ncbi:MAG: hypothetical protein KDB10_00730, partial [Acidimicrobiales bacterium]|nr:hypothetical protein [Acidimicrobiales bacterium]